MIWLEIVGTLFDLANKKQELSEKKRERLSELFSKISTVIDDVATKLENDEYPSKSCSIMQDLSINIMLLVNSELPEDKAEELAIKLNKVCFLEEEYAQRKSNDTIKNLRMISGKFEALSMMYSL